MPQKLFHKRKLSRHKWLLTCNFHFSFTIHSQFNLFLSFSLCKKSISPSRHLTISPSHYLASFILTLFSFSLCKKNPSHHLAISPSHYLASFILTLLSFSLCKPKSACSHFFFLTEISSPILCLLSKPYRLYYYWIINTLWRLQWTSDP